MSTASLPKFLDLSDESLRMTADMWATPHGSLSELASSGAATRAVVELMMAAVVLANPALGIEMLNIHHVRPEHFDNSDIAAIIGGILSPGNSDVESVLLRVTDSLVAAKCWDEAAAAHEWRTRSMWSAVSLLEMSKFWAGDTGWLPSMEPLHREAIFELIVDLSSIDQRQKKAAELIKHAKLLLAEAA